MEYRWGIIGTGEVAYDVTYAIRNQHGNRVVAVASRTKENADRFAGINGIKKVYQRYKDLIKDEEVDIVYIAAPNTLHFEFICLCFMQGKNVLCEKPLTLNAIQARQVKIMSQEKGLFCMEALWVRFIPSMHKLHEIVQSGQLGQIKLITGSFGHVIKKNNPKQDGNGVLLNLGVYLISTCISLFGKPDKVDTFLSMKDNETDEQASIILNYDNGISAILNCSHLTNLNNEFSVHGEKGTVRLCRPFYRSAFIEMEKTSFIPEVSENPEKKDIRRNPYHFPWLFKYLPFFKRFLVKKVLSNSIAIPFKGNAYHYQIMEVNRCLDLKLNQSPLMPLDLSISVIEVMDEIRKKFNITYRGE